MVALLLLTTVNPKIHLQLSSYQELGEYHWILFMSLHFAESFSLVSTRRWMDHFSSNDDLYRPR